MDKLKKPLLCGVLFAAGISYAQVNNDDKGMLLELRGYSVSASSVYGYNVLSMSRNSNDNNIYFEFPQDLFYGGSTHIYVKNWKNYSAPNDFNRKYCLNAYQPRQYSSVSVYDCRPFDDEQIWELRANMNKGGKYQFKLKNTNLCLNSNSTNEGSKLILFKCDINDSDQLFNLFIDY